MERVGGGSGSQYETEVVNKNRRRKSLNDAFPVRKNDFYAIKIKENSGSVKSKIRNMLRWDFAQYFCSPATANNPQSVLDPTVSGRSAVLNQFLYLKKKKEKMRSTCQYELPRCETSTL